MKYHEPDGQWFEQTVAEVWFDRRVGRGSRLHQAGESSACTSPSPLRGWRASSHVSAAQACSTSRVASRA